MTTKLIDTATLESTSWQFLTDPHDEYEAWRRAMVEDLYNDGEPLDWGVNPDTVDMLQHKASLVANRFDVSPEDLYEDTILHLAVRPTQANTDTPQLLGFRAYQVASNLAKTTATKQAREDSLEAVLSAPARDLE